jgi:hypothetical protein
LRGNFTRRVGFLRLYPSRRVRSIAARVRSVGRRVKFLPRRRDRPQASSFGRIISYFGRRGHHDLNRFGVLPRCGGMGRSCCATLLGWGFRLRATPWPNRSRRQSFVNHKRS